MRRAIFPGSFDPPTNGHLDIIKRSLPLFDEIIIAVLNNPEKNPMFTVEERCEMIREIVRGIRAISDYEYELRMALMNRRLEPTIETVFLMAAEEYAYVSSNLMKQVFTLGGRVEGLIPALVEARMREKLNG
jgi:pantetheine-phosphate adenylyltransferase